MKILMSALACEPGNGSELEVGFRAMLAAARLHEVWVLTNTDSVPALRRALAGRPEADRVHLEGIDLGVDAEGIALLTIPGFHLYYDRWQRRAAARAIELDRQVDFDVVHHATLAAYWPRAGVAVLEKPLVWGPVGGGVEPPLSLLRELGWRGMIEDAGRLVIRRLLGRFGPSRQVQRRAVVTFAQNRDTLARIRTSGDISIMSNATVIDLGNLRISGTRGKDVYFVGRLVHWKGPLLALRAFRHLRNSEARLVFCGQGPERARLERAVERWGLTDRVSFIGWLRRDELVSRIALAGALVHPALHEEGGLCVAEALALGTPAVCLDHGGPPEVLRQWPNTPSAGVSVSDSETTARRIADAIDRFLDNPPPVCSEPRASVMSFEQQLCAAYEVAAASGRAMVWAFPRGKPQLFANSPQALAHGVTTYAFGRRLPRLMQTGIALQMRFPLLRLLVSQRQPRVEPVCGRPLWQELAEGVQRRNQDLSGEWLHFSSQWDKRRSSFIGLDSAGNPALFLTIEAIDNPSHGPLRPAASYRVPACRHAFRHGNWSVREFEPLPQFHRPARWDPARIRQVATDVSRALEGRFERPRDLPAHWRPMHGDLVPWNLREDEHQQLWLLDWEDAGWGPPLADLLRFILAHYSLRQGSPAVIAGRVRSILSGESEEALAEATNFWLQHHNFQQAAGTTNWSRRKAKDAARGAREFAALCVLARETS